MRLGRRPSRAAGPRKKWGPRRHSRRMLLGGWAAIGATAILVSGTLYGYAKYRGVLDSIKQITVVEPGKRPPKDPNAMNVLVIGSDSRSGKNGAIGGSRGIGGQRSDTVMIAHISPGQSKMAVLSFPRDTAVPVLQCLPEPGFAGQTAQPGIVEQLNNTFAYGGPGCLWRTLEYLTNIHIDDFVQINFTGFISVINALGGVEVCLPYSIHAHFYDHFHLAAGRHRIWGHQALEFWRLREGFGLGSDLQRIQRDQLLMVGLVQRILHTRVLNSLPKTYSIIHAITAAHALTTDTGLTQSKMVSIAAGMAGISSRSIQFVEVPVVTYLPNPSWVAFDQAQDPGLFSAIAHDTKLPKIIKKRSKKGAPVKLLSAAEVNVEVLNGSGVNGIAGKTATALTGRGFHVLGSTGATTPSGAPDYSYTKSVVEYRSAADLAAAQTVAAQLTNVTLRQVASVPAGTVNLILGSDFKALKTKSSARPLGNLTSHYGGYTGRTNVCGKANKSAFMR